jgi:uncharacterized protein (DUF1810 family)
MSDPFFLARFINAQRIGYDRALEEIRQGRKRTHWIWYVFPQIEGMGRSYESRTFAISGLEEARAYLQHPVLGPRLEKITKVLLDLPGNDPLAVMSSGIDVLKLQASMTLFAEAEPENPLFQRVLEKYYGGKKHQKSLALMKKNQ